METMENKIIEKNINIINENICTIKYNNIVSDENIKDNVSKDIEYLNKNNTDDIFKTYNQTYSTNILVNNMKFDNECVQTLYDKIHSYEVSQLKTTNEIHNALIADILNVINNKDGYKEACTKWQAFVSISEHIVYNQSTFKQMDFYTSMCFTLWMYIYH